MIEQRIFSNHKQLLLGYLAFGMREGLCSEAGVTDSPLASDFSYMLVLQDRANTGWLNEAEDLELTPEGAFLADESKMSLKALQDKYYHRGDKAHPKFRKTDWVYQTIHDQTELGYWEWVKTQLDEAAAVKEEARIAAMVERVQAHHSNSQAT